MIDRLLKKAALSFSLLVSCVAADAQDSTTNSKNAATAKRFNIHFQTTYIYQYKPEFGEQYHGANSLQSAEEKQNSVTATLYLGARLWKGAELYINPEMAGGSGLSGAFGLGASTNGETFRVGNPEPTIYLGRGYLSQILPIGKETTLVEEGANETGGNKPVNYLKFYLGKMCLGDIFDNNVYANSPRTQFMNWCLMNNGAWDYAANTRGYTYAFVTVLQNKSMTYKAALATLPITANGPELNTDLSEEYAINAEVSKTYTIKKRTGNIHVFGYQNSGHMGNYAEATKNALGVYPDIVSNRKFGRTKTGFGISADQQISANAGVFARVGWNDGKNETWAYTEVDRLVSVGLALNGAKWHRKDDNLSIGLVANGLSPDHKNYLAAGGLGFQLGDGRLTYTNEAAAEIYYSCKPSTTAGIWLSADYQFVMNPGYNKDRGPLNVFSFRLHVEL